MSAEDIRWQKEADKKAEEQTDSLIKAQKNMGNLTSKDAELAKILRSESDK